MAEEVIFDDSPMARYLKELEQENKIQHATVVSSSLNEEILKALNEISHAAQVDQEAKIQKPIHKSSNSEKKEDPKLIFFKYLEPEIYASLTADESIRTPKYAELILDSSLINAENYDEANFNHDTQSNPSTTPSHSTSINISSHTVKNIIALLVLGVFIIKGVVPSIAFLFFVYFSITLYARYRIRQLQSEGKAEHYKNISRIEEFIDYSIKFDKLVKRVVITIAEVELVSRGYKLSYPLSPITRLEQNAKQRKCQMLRKQLAESLLCFDAKYKVIMDSLSIDVELENINEDSNSLAYLKHIRSRVHVMRTQFLESFISVCKHEPLRARDFLTLLVQISDSLREEQSAIEKTLQRELYISNDLNLPQVKKHKETLENQFVLSINNLQTQLQSIIARINLCKQDLSLYNIEKHSEDVDNTRSNVDLQNEMNELLKHFSRIKSELEESIKNWESSNSLLIKLIEKMNKERDPKRDTHQPPSTSTELEYEPTIVALERSEEKEQDLGEKVYEGSTGGEAEEDETERRLKSREERILEMKLRREQQAQRQAAMLEKLAIIQELKGVLEVRAQSKINK
jgi:hypothetical protein